MTSFFGCQGHLSTQEAYAICGELTTEGGAAFPEEVFDDCVDCHETCGNDCVFVAGSPATFACPAELEQEDGESDSSESSES